MVKIENVIHDNVEKVDIIDVKVITNPTQDQYIVADETGFISITKILFWKKIPSSKQ